MEEEPGDRQEASLNRYRIGPLTYVTDLTLPELPLALPELAPAHPGQPSDAPLAGEREVTVRLGETPATLSAPLAVAESYEGNDTEFLLRIPGVANYYAHDGTEIVVQPAPGTSELDMRAYLLGSLFAAICHQRGLLPLHASAIATARGAVAFLGDSGAGKSSLAAFLARRGYRVLADDICLLDLEAARERRVLPVAPWLKLWNTALDALGEPKSAQLRVYTDDEKYLYRLDQPPTPTALAEIIVLERAEGAAVCFERLAPVRALGAVLEKTYQSWLIRAMGRTEAYFPRYSRALEGARVTRMLRPWGFDKMEATLAALEAHIGGETGSV